MGYVIAAIIVILLIAGFVALLVRSAARRTNMSDAGDSDPRGIVTSDRQTPVGDTSEHAGADGLNDAPSHDDRPDVARPLVGGEGEARRSV